MRFPPPFHTITLLAAAAQIRSVNGIPVCPYPGPAFPKPKNLAASEAVQTALTNLTATFNARAADPSLNPNGTSWSIQVFSAASDDALWEHYHTATTLLSSTTPGVKTVDGDSVYRLGSLTKIFTIMTFLAEAGDTYWNTPVTRWVPELELLADKAQYDPILNVAWDSVTLGDLASHMAGIVRDYALQGELTQENNQTVLMAQGFPPALADMTPVCGETRLCNRDQFFAGLANVPPSFAPSQTPAYSNAGYQILAYALEAITQKNFTQMIQADVIDKIGLQRTFYSKPDDALGVIPPDAFDNGYWGGSLGEASPTGNMYSSASDLSRLGRAIYRHTVLPAPLTRRWLRPAALTSDRREALGYPWGLRRIALSPDNESDNREVDAFGKAGSINVYMSLLVLLPDYEVGIAALLAGGWPGNANWDIADAIGSALVPALETAAREEAGVAFAGVYNASSSSGGGGNGNSSITLSTTPGLPGLGVESWVSNGTDMVPVAVRYTLNYNVTGPSIRLYPTGLETVNNATGQGGRRVAFKAVVENLALPDRRDKMFSTNCGTWVGQTSAVYADMPLDQFVFALDDDGNAVSVEPLALRTPLLKVANATSTAGDGDGDGDDGSN
ncbi:beta-lactamase/transpeptidase-like protein [Xylariaceae sp. FL0662B]|nr:beta-lactamase/transpeptidase-like protein [Xylariaceae sp. FL0662B]